MGEARAGKHGRLHGKVAVVTGASRATTLTTFVPATSRLHWGRPPTPRGTTPTPGAGKSPRTSTVMFIHGAWLSPASFDPFQDRYEAQGFHCVAPAWPYQDRPAGELRRASPPELARLSIVHLVDHYASHIRGLSQPPFLIGHDLGGLIVQLLLARGLGAAGVAIASAPPRGVLTHPRAIWTQRSVLLTWNGWNRVLTISPEASPRDSCTRALPRTGGGHTSGT